MLSSSPASTLLISTRIWPSEKTHILVLYQIRSDGDAAPARANVCWIHFSRLEVIAGGVAWILIPPLE
ncbi:hypothetical protein OIU79_027836 [Salix purpurea]|uniref:Uncharacterized protein n=1 Tax=Salix purpurea TaxID=77065 RepID=A0A9Q0VX62_SALPP|nr:hypothetical protein OIU79_027836 [Salix purpurea]